MFCFGRDGISHPIGARLRDAPARFELLCERVCAQPGPAGTLSAPIEHPLVPSCLAPPRPARRSGAPENEGDDLEQFRIAAGVFAAMIVSLTAAAAARVPATALKDDKTSDIMLSNGLVRVRSHAARPGRFKIFPIGYSG